MGPKIELNLVRSIGVEPPISQRYDSSGVVGLEFIMAKC